MRPVLISRPGRDWALIWIGSIHYPFLAARTPVSRLAPIKTKPPTGAEPGRVRKPVFSRLCRLSPPGRVDLAPGTRREPRS